MKFHWRSALVVVGLLGAYIPARIFAPVIADALEPVLIASLASIGVLSRKD